MNDHNAFERLIAEVAPEAMGPTRPVNVEAVVASASSAVSLEALAEALDVPLGTVNTRLHRALGRMREALVEASPAASPEGALR